jgi:hypothetical protein
MSPRSCNIRIQWTPYLKTPQQIDSESYVVNLHKIKWRMAARTRAMNSSELNGFVM